MFTKNLNSKMKNFPISFLQVVLDLVHRSAGAYSRVYNELITQILVVNLILKLQPLPPLFLAHTSDMDEMIIFN